MNETHMFKKVFEPMVKAFCAVAIIGLIALMFLSGSWLAENKNKGFIIINNRLNAMQSQLDAQLDSILLTEAEVIGWLNLTPAELEFWIEDGLRCYAVSGKRFYFEQDVIGFIKAQQKH